MVLKLRVTPAGDHIEVLHFMGHDRDHLARVGSLTMRSDEWLMYRCMLGAGESVREGRTLIVEER